MSRREFDRTIRMHQAARKVARTVSVIGLWGRNRMVELLLRGAFGDVVEADGHLFSVDPRDRVTGVLMRRRGFLNPPETWLYKRIVRPGMTALDLGANLGYFTMLLARAVGPTGRVFAFEPDPDNFALLEHNVRLNGYSNVAAIRAAVADTDRALSLYRDPANFGDHRLRASVMERNSISVPVTRLDTFFPQPTTIDFIKMDIQGAEQAAMRGGVRLLGENPRLLIAAEFWPDGIREYGGDPRGFLDELRSSGFTLSIIGEPGSLPRLLDSERELDRIAAGRKTLDLLFHREPLRL